MTSPDSATAAAALERLDRFSFWTDSNFRIPFTGFRFGLSPLIGLVPVVGDFVGLLLSLYVLREARRVGASRKIQGRMVFNMLIEFLGGLLPVIGDAFDAIYKANTRNTALLRGWLVDQIDTEPRQPFPWFTLVWLSALILLLGIVLVAVLL
ncbi:MAG: DUF4112 domain-containing protein [Gammaproteobacteria bacterium]|jgi:hypothetical protein|nr:DUF4112 domain-containing protein [Gammaproteobacteria bacterium]